MHVMMSMIHMYPWITPCARAAHSAAALRAEPRNQSVTARVMDLCRARTEGRLDHGLRVRPPSARRRGLPSHPGIACASALCIRVRPIAGRVRAHLARDLGGEEAHRDRRRIAGVKPAGSARGSERAGLDACASTRMHARTVSPRTYGRTCGLGTWVEARTHKRTRARARTAERKQGTPSGHCSRGWPPRPLRGALRWARRRMGRLRASRFQRPRAHQQGMRRCCLVKSSGRTICL